MLACLLLLLAAPQSRDDGAGMAIEMRSVSAQVAALRHEMIAFRLEMKERQEAIEAVKTDLAGLREEARRERAASLAGPFLSSPPAGSDSLGVAKGAVFAPRVEAESPRRRDTILLKVKRIEPGALRTVAEVELPPDGVFADLPIDLSGALYLCEWSTTDGQSYNLVLRDGASGQPAATVPVKPLQSQGRFVFVGYRVE
jgi:hypothetical protein